MEPNARVMRLDPSMEDAIKNDRCYMGGEQVYVKLVTDVLDPQAEGPGHIYSAAGLREYKNSGACEFHFDKAFETLADEVYDEEPMTPEEEETMPLDRGGHQDDQDVSDLVAADIRALTQMGFVEACFDCGEEGATTGHMGCQYPRNRD
jgi:hypothetical protein